MNADMPVIARPTVDAEAQAQLVSRVRRDRRRRMRQVTTAVWVTRVVLLAAALLGWWQLSETVYWRLLVGSPSGVWKQLASWATDDTFWNDVKTTVVEAAIGYACAVILVVVATAIIASWKPIAKFVGPFIAAANALPKITLAPLFILWLGFGVQSKILFVMSAVFFVLFYGLYSGVRNVDRVLIENLRVLGASRIGLVYQVYVPSIVVWLVASLRLSAAWAFTSAVLAEYLGSNSGLGYRIAQGQETLNPDIVLAGILVVAIIATLVDRALLLAEARFTRWRVF